jgi:hypothetical protein
MIDALGEQKISGRQQIGLARAEHILRLDLLTTLDQHATSRLVRQAIHPHQTAFTSSAQTIRPARAMQLGTSRKQKPISGDQRQRQRLTTPRLQPLTVVKQLYGTRRLSKTRRHHQSLADSWGVRQRVRQLARAEHSR